MMEGSPIISTDHQPMPELLGDAALYYRAGDGDQLGVILREALGRPHAFVNDLGARARGRASRYTWNATARGLVAQLQLAVDRCASST
jgi:glycosyltransferase involved in cell wall biosynthesis